MTMRIHNVLRNGTIVYSGNIARKYAAHHRLEYHEVRNYNNNHERIASHAR